ncbi:MAG: hypothetical protein LH467_13245 [Gemmatimonadaceae bacterium]|nr:hypothetical protein [Gemmatimonadaceae bacterium]
MARSEPTRGPRRWLASLSLAGTVLAFSAPSARAQYTVSGLQPLAFGYLTQGLTEIVAYTDVFRRGDVTIAGTGIPWVKLTLPTSLSGPNGAAIPLQFLLGDVAVEENGRPPAAFDPAGSTRVNLKRGTAHILIGGRALPAANQPAGAYSGTIVIIVSPTAI